MHKRVLAVYPHPDDETFGNAGALARHAVEGTQVTLICATLGQMGRRMGRPFFATRETLPKIREEELKAACQSIGVHDLRMWKMQDKTLQFRKPDYLSDRILAVIEEVKPTLIYTYYPKHGVHPDHDALSAATARAIRKIPENERPSIYGIAITKDCNQTLGEPDIELDVSDVFDRKMAALRAHRSQTELMIRKLEQDISEHTERESDLLAHFRKEKFWIYDFAKEVL